MLPDDSDGGGDLAVREGNLVFYEGDKNNENEALSKDKSSK